MSENPKIAPAVQRFIDRGRSIKSTLEASTTSEQKIREMQAWRISPKPPILAKYQIRTVWFLLGLIAGISIPLLRRWPWLCLAVFAFFLIIEPLDRKIRDRLLRYTEDDIRNAAEILELPDQHRNFLAVCLHHFEMLYRRL